MIDLALALWVLGALYGESDPAVGTELAASVFLPGGEAASMLIGPSLGGAAGCKPLSDDNR